jgi:hypothetical protein
MDVMRRPLPPSYEAGDWGGQYDLIAMLIGAGQLFRFLRTLAAFDLSEKRKTSPSEIVGWVKIASRNMVNGIRPTIAVWTAAISSLASTPKRITRTSIEIFEWDKSPENRIGIAP